MRGAAALAASSLAAALILGAYAQHPVALVADEGVPKEERSMTEFMKLWDFKDPAATEARFRALLPELQSAKDIGLRIEVLTQIARCQGLQQRSKEAHLTLDQADALLGEGMERPRARLLLERGRAINGIPGATDPEAATRRQRSRPLFAQAWTVATAAGEDGLALDAAHMLGIVEEPAVALAWNLKAIQLAEASTNEAARRWLGTLYNNTGWTYFERKEYDKALEMFERDVAHRGRLEQVVPQRIARWSRAKALRMLGRYDEALAVQLALEREWDAAGEPDGYVFEELGECLLALGRGDEARPWFARAYAILAADSWLAQNEAPRIERIKALGAEATTDSR